MKHMNFLYIHGFQAFFDPNAPKVKTLEKIGTVIGASFDYRLPFDVIKAQMIKIVNDHNIDIIIGNSLGGYWASIIGTATGLPFVSCNPSVQPSVTLQKYVGVDLKTFNGNDLTMSLETIQSYLPFDLNGYGIVLLDREDELFDSEVTKSKLEHAYNVHMFDGGSHRFDHMEDSLSIISNFYGTTK